MPPRVGQRLRIQRVQLFGGVIQYSPAPTGPVAVEEKRNSNNNKKENNGSSSNVHRRNELDKRWGIIFSLSAH